MALFDRFTNRVSQRPSTNVVRRVAEYFGFIGSYGVGESPVLTRQKAMEISPVNCAVRLIAESVSGAPFEVYERKLKGNRKIFKIRDDHPLNALLERPNSYQTQSEFLETVIYSAILGTGALIVKVTDGAGTVTELWPIPLGLFTQEILADGSSQFVVDFEGGIQRVYHRSECIFFHGVGHNGYSAFPPPVAAKHAFGVISSLEKAQRSYADSSGTPRGIISLTDEMENPELGEKIAAAWEQRFKAGQGGIPVVAGSVEFTNLSENFNDSKFLEQRQFMVHEIARFFKIPTSYMLGEGKLDKATQDYFITNAIMPWLRRIEQALTKDFIKEPNIVVRADETALFRADLTAQADFIMKLTGLGGGQAILTVNEGRSLVGYEEKDDPKYDILSDGGYAEVSGLRDRNNSIQSEETDANEEDDEKEDK